MLAAISHVGHCALPFGQHFADALHLSADRAQLFFNALVAAVDVVDAIDDGFAVGDEGGEDERGGGAEIAGEDGGAAKGCFAADDGATSFDFNVRAHANEFEDVHEAVLENIFG